MKKKLTLRKQTIENLNQGDMVKLKAGGPGCHYPTLQNWECNTIPPSEWTCDGAGTCHCMSYWPV